jgi:hypothetical protein
VADVAAGRVQSVAVELFGLDVHDVNWGKGVDSVDRGLLSSLTQRRPGTGIPVWGQTRTPAVVVPTGTPSTTTAVGIP